MRTITTHPFQRIGSTLLSALVYLHLSIYSFTTPDCCHGHTSNHLSTQLQVPDNICSNPIKKVPQDLLARLKCWCLLELYLGGQEAPCLKANVVVLSVAAVDLLPAVSPGTSGEIFGVTHSIFLPLSPFGPI